MDLSPERIQALTEFVGMARMQEYIVIPLYCLYVYYVVTTIAEEVSIILPQQWNRGKTLYVVIRHGMLVAIALQLTAEYRNYYSMSPAICKALSVSYEIANSLVLFACDFSLGLCLSALLQAKTLYCVAILVLSCTLTIVNSIFSVVSNLQYPAVLPSPLMKELGYACYYISQEDWVTKTIANLGRNIRTYLSLATIALLFMLGVVTFVVRYKGQGSQLVRVIRRDAGLYYLSLLAIRLALSILRTPAVLMVSELDGHPGYLFANVGITVFIPILAQRLLINMRKVDYMGSQPVASKLLFAPPAPGSEDDLEADLDSFEMVAGRSDLRHRGDTDEPSGVCGARSGSDNA